MYSIKKKKQNLVNQENSGYHDRSTRVSSSPCRAPVANGPEAPGTSPTAAPSRLPPPVPAVSPS